MQPEEEFTGQESIELITRMIHKAKNSYHNSGAGLLLWGTTLTIVNLVSFAERKFDFYIGFDIWILILVAIIPQVYLSIKNKGQKKFKSHTDVAIDAVWLTYGITILGLVIYQNIVPSATMALTKSEGWVMMKHYMVNSKPDEVLQPFAPSIYSIYLLTYCVPTIITGIVKHFKPMIFGALIGYALFIVSCFTASSYDMLFGAITAIFCWLIPGLIFRKRFNMQKQGNV